MPLFLILVAVPLIEIALFIKVGGWLGLWPTLAIVVVTAALGTVLLRSQGRAELGEMRRRLEALEDPTETLASGAMILFAGALLLTPGFFTDTVGLLLMVPAVRHALYLQLRKRLRPVSVGPGPRPHPGPGPTIDGDFEDVTPRDSDRYPPIR